MGLRDVFRVRYTGLIDSAGLYGIYRVPDPEAPYQQDYIIDKQGKIGYWEVEYDYRECLETIEKFLKYNPTVNVDVVPDAAQVHPGDNLEYTVTFTNNTDIDQLFHATLEEIQPNSNRVMLWGPVLFNVPGGSTVMVPLSESIPGNAPLGSYSFKVKIGTAQDGVWDVDGFGFKVY